MKNGLLAGSASSSAIMVVIWLLVKLVNLRASS